MALEHFKNDSVIYVTNALSGKNLRLHKGAFDVNGGKGESAQWKVHRLNPRQQPAKIMLENVGQSGHYVRISKDGDLDVGKGGSECELEVLEKGNEVCFESKKNSKFHLGGNEDGSVQKPKETGTGTHARFRCYLAEGSKVEEGISAKFGAFRKKAEHEAQEHGLKLGHKKDKDKGKGKGKGHGKGSGSDSDSDSDSDSEKKSKSKSKSKPAAAAAAAAAVSDDSPVAAFLAQHKIRPSDQFWNLNYEKIGDDGAELIAQGIRVIPTVTDIVLYDDHIGPAGATALANAIIDNTTLKSLSLNCNKIGNTGAIAFAGALKVNSALTSLSLYECDIGDEGASALADALATNKTLTYLNLNKNKISKRSGPSFANGIASNNALKELRLFRNKLGDEGGEQIANALEKNGAIESLDLRHSGLSNRLLKRIEAMTAPQARLARAAALGAQSSLDVPRLRITVENGEGFDLHDDCLVQYFVGSQSHSTGTVQNSATPKWDDSFTVTVPNPYRDSILFTVYDTDKEKGGVKLDDLLGVGSLSIGGLAEGVERREKVLLVGGKRPQSVIYVGLCALNFSSTRGGGGSGDGQGGGDGSGLGGELLEKATAELAELRAVNAQLGSEVSTLRSLNEELKATAAQLEGEVKEMTVQNDRYSQQNDRLEKEIEEFKAQNARLESGVAEMKSQVDRLDGEVSKFAEQNDRLEGSVKALQQENEALAAIREGLDEGVEKMRQENETMRNNLVELEATNKSLHRETERLGHEVNRFAEENKKLEAVRDELDAKVKELGAEVGNLHSENNRLEAIEGKLTLEVASFSNKVKVMEGEIQNLQRTREMLGEQVAKQELQNDRLQDELDQLANIQKGMEQFAAKQGQDYAQFVQKLEESINRNQSLIEEFSKENNELKETRKRLRIQQCLTLSNSFQHWDGKVGLSTDEFDSYLMMLGSDFTEALDAKYGGDRAALFAQLDADRSGSLNITELRVLLKELIDRMELEEA